MLSNKIKKKLGEKTSELDMMIATAIAELESSSEELKPHLRDLVIRGTMEVDVKDKKAIVVFVPMPQLRQYQKIHSRLVRELEKKFSGKHVLLVGWRRIIRREKHGLKAKKMQKRPYSRTRKAVMEARLGDICYPAEIVAKRIRVKLDGAVIHKIFLDKSQSTVVDHKLETFSAVYKKFSRDDAKFSFLSFVL